MGLYFSVMKYFFHLHDLYWTQIYQDENENFLILCEIHLFCNFTSIICRMDKKKQKVNPPPHLLFLNDVDNAV